MRRRAPHRVTQRWLIYWVQETDCVSRLQCRCQREGRRSERTEVRQARLDRRSGDSEESVVFSGSISVELDSEGPSCQLVLNIKIWILKMLNHSSTHQWLNIPVSARSGFLYQLAQACPHNVLQFLVLMNRETHLKVVFFCFKLNINQFKTTFLVC